ncbi:MAG: hypothetical protein C5B55_02910 [Blastocatellia bacterium]|nr:MAG: hypothetical protein C5B55_02910 [Blastocatellia bacterium]
MSHNLVEELLQELSSHNPEVAWGQFLSDYSNLIYNVIRHFESDADNAADVFQFVCERLIENRAKRLRKFKGEGTASFATWLRAVVRNLCIDWHRKQSGRIRQFRSISRLSIFDQEVFRAVYENATPPDECVSLLAAQFPNTTLTRIEESRARIDQSLTVNQRWLLSKRATYASAGDVTSLDQSDGSTLALEDSQPDPETRAIDNEQRRNLQRALRQLKPDERLLIRLRFEEGLTLEKVADLLDLGNAQRADRLIKDILAQLAKLIAS